MSEDKLIASNERMELLSKAYIRTIAGFCGYGVDIIETDHDSVDLIISSSAGVRPKLDIQLKASGNIDDRRESFSYPLQIKNYNDLRIEVINTRILVVFCMPKEQNEWIEHSVEHLLIRKCAYWASLKGKPVTSNTESVSVTIQTKNVMSPDGLRSLMEKIDRKETI